MHRSSATFSVVSLFMTALIFEFSTSNAQNAYNESSELSSALQNLGRPSLNNFPNPHILNSSTASCALAVSIITLGRCCLYTKHVLLPSVQFLNMFLVTLSAVLETFPTMVKNHFTGQASKQKFYQPAMYNHQVPKMLQQSCLSPSSLTALLLLRVEAMLPLLALPTSKTA